MKMFTKIAVVCVIGAALVAGVIDSVKAEEYPDLMVVGSCIALVNEDIQINAKRERYEILIELNKYKVVGNNYLINVSSTIVSEDGYVSHKPKFLTIVCELRGDMVYPKAMEYMDM